jgi:hypothetical protein
VRFRVRIGALARGEVDQRYGVERSSEGRPNRADFEQGPLAAARLQFERFDSLPETVGPSVRHCHVLVPGFTPIVFIGVLVEPDLVEIAGFDEDPDYWDLIENDPRN